MDNQDKNSNKIANISLSRNVPVALVVGGASFFGSCLIDKLLEKNLQIVATDSLKYGKKNYLTEASENKDFHLLIDSLEDLDIDLQRLDYIFIIPHPDIRLHKILELFKKLKPRLLLISSIKLYEEGHDLKWLRKTESEIATIAKEHNLNARILRLGSIFGPRMNFADAEPMTRLIQQSLLGDLQKEISLDFSSRALFIDEAVNLAVKCIFAGATAQKIFDGVLPAPIKVSEVKQILLDPVWYESRQFSPTELPPWPTPNLEKTVKFLNWHPKIHLVSCLKQTLAYFKDNEINIPQMAEVKEVKIDEKSPVLEDKAWKEEKIAELKGLRGEEKEEKKNKGRGVAEFFLPFLVILFIMYVLVWPILQMSWGVLSFKWQLSKAVDNLDKGQFNESLSGIKQAKDGILQAKTIYLSLETIRKTGLLKNEFEVGDSLINLASLSSDAASSTVLGVQSLYQSLKSITGESSESPQGSFDSAGIYLTLADEKLSKAQALIKSADFQANLPTLLKGRINNLAEKLNLYAELVKKGRALSVLLPQIVAMDGTKSYLILLQDNAEIRPTGGLISSYANVSFENGKLKNLQVSDINNLDNQLKIHVEPPKEIRSDLNQKDYLLKDANFEPDFPTSAKQIEWFYAKETNQRVSGVVALDVSAIEDLLKVIEGLELSDYQEKITSDNIWEKSISHASDQKNFFTTLGNALFNKLFFLPNQNWPQLANSLGKSAKEKHLSIYLDDPALFSYLVAQKWAGVLPRASEKEISSDFLAVAEANLGLNKANYYLDRKYDLETKIGQDLGINHKLRISYTNRSSADAFPQGKYKNRIRVYLPSGSKLNKALWGETDVTKETASFVDYGRTGFSLLVELNPKEQKVLVLDYQTSIKLEFQDKKASYRLDVIKQAGILNDPFEWKIAYPIDVRLSSNQNNLLEPKEQIIKTQLSEDKSFQLEFSRP